MSKTAVFTKLNDVICFFETDGKVLFQADLAHSETDDNDEVGGIYYGKVISVSENLSACFIEYKRGMTGFLPLNKSELKKTRPGESFPVTVTKARVKTKDAVLSRELSYAGLYAVVNMGNGGLRFSSKLSDEVKQKISDCLKDDPKIKDHTVIIRSFCGCLDLDLPEDKALLLSEINESINNLDKIKMYSDKRTEHSFLGGGTGFIRNALSKIDLSDVRKIVTDDPGLFEKITASVPAKIRDICEFYSDDYPLTALYNLKKQVSEIVSKRIWLKSGGYMIVEHTEAMTVIDVNTGKNESKISKNELIKRTNEEAIERAAFLITAGGFSGSILIDLVGTSFSESDKQKMMELMENRAKNDHDRVKVVDITPLGIMEMTRMKRSRMFRDKLKEAGIYETFTDA